MAGNILQDALSALSARRGKLSLSAQTVPVAQQYFGYNQ